MSRHASARLPLSLGSQRLGNFCAQSRIVGSAAVICEAYSRNHTQCVRTGPPHPEWKPGDNQPLPFDGEYISLCPKELGGSACYPLVISAIVPRPIGFISTKSKDGQVLTHPLWTVTLCTLWRNDRRAKLQVNLSPYSYFGAMGHDPPLV